MVNSCTACLMIMDSQLLEKLVYPNAIEQLYPDASADRV